jgi:GTP-binding protein
MKRPKLAAAEFVTSAAGAKDLPRGDLLEIAFAGRSNVGKSSLINDLVGRKLARTSAEPGKTRLVNYFVIRPEGGRPFHLVDLPGYGYARGAAGGREFGTLVHEYFFGGVAADRLRPAIAGVVLLVDSRHPELESDHEAWTWLHEHGCRVVVVATKIDKLSRADRHRAERTLAAKYGSPTVSASVLTGEGLEDLWKQMRQLLEPRSPREV